MGLPLSKTPHLPHHPQGDLERPVDVAPTTSDGLSVRRFCKGCPHPDIPPPVHPSKELPKLRTPPKQRKLFSCLIFMITGDLLGIRGEALVLVSCIEKPRHC